MRFKRRLSPNATVDLIPMIDVVFQLVVFFMVSSTFIMTPGIGLVLPDSSTAEPVVMTKLVITVVSQDEVYLNKEKYTLDGLNDALKNISTDEKDAVKTVILEGDKSLPYSLIVKVLDVLRESGYKGVNLKMREPG